MIQAELVFGITGILIGFHLIYITWQIMSNVEQSSKIRLALSMPHRNVQRALLCLIGSFLILGIGMGAAGIGAFYQHSNLDLYSRIAATVGILGLNYFLITLAYVTRQESSVEETRHG